MDFNETQKLQNVELIGSQPGVFFYPVLFQTVSNYCTGDNPKGGHLHNASNQDAIVNTRPECQMSRAMTGGERLKFSAFCFILRFFLISMI